MMTEEPMTKQYQAMADDSKRVVFVAEQSTKHCLPHISSAFCCLSLRTGSAIYGWFYTLAGIIAMTAFSQSVPFYIIFLALMDDKSDEPDYIFAGIIVQTVAVILLLVPLFAISLLVGVHKREPAFLKPFIVLLSIYIIFDILFILISMFADVNFEIEEFQVKNLSYASCGYPSISIVRTLVGIHSLLVINSYHTELRDQSFGYKLQV